MAHPRNTPQYFWNKVDIRSENDCWNWLGTLGKDSYGRARFDVKDWQAHRLAWTLTNGEIPFGLLVCHSCDNPKCCNPKHLFLGTSLDNNRDRDSKGRHASTDKIFAHLHPEFYKGENNSHAKLTNTQVTNIRKLHADGQTIAAIARSFNMSESQIARIVHQEGWIR